ncbi:dienelactone hydrolase family protein [Viridibacterium curvum]|uniref:Dienelactone hydrolase family protein n=1 Tax=Viridibacterium curvum TaxID=1101404 RepID=A0ABP9QJ14_9RHOO
MIRCAALLLCLLCSPAHAATAEAVSIPAAGFSSSPTDLRAQLFKPDTPGPHPAVVMIHGCGGAYAKDGSLNARHQMWGEYLAANGYVALMLDSFSSRGLAEICTQKFSDRTIKESDRVGDTYAALSWLRQQAGVKTDRIALLGWSHGAGVTLDAIRRQPKAIDKGFAAAVSFYPGCTNRNKKADSFKPYAPLLILIGEADDWTPAAPCVELTSTARAAGAPMQIHTYPGAYHDFDNPGVTRVRLRKDVPNGVNPGQGVHTGPDPEAREDAKRRVLAFFAGQLK